MASGSKKMQRPPGRKKCSGRKKERRKEPVLLPRAPPPKIAACDRMRTPRQSQELGSARRASEAPGTPPGASKFNMQDLAGTSLSMPSERARVATRACGVAKAVYSEGGSESNPRLTQLTALLKRLHPASFPALQPQDILQVRQGARKCMSIRVRTNDGKDRRVVMCPHSKNTPLCGISIAWETPAPGSPPHARTPAHQNPASATLSDEHTGTAEPRWWRGTESGTEPFPARPSDPGAFCKWVLVDSSGGDASRMW